MKVRRMLAAAGLALGLTFAMVLPAQAHNLISADFTCSSVTAHFANFSENDDPYGVTVTATTYTGQNTVVTGVESGSFDVTVPYDQPITADGQVANVTASWQTGSGSITSDPINGCAPPPCPNDPQYTPGEDGEECPSPTPTPPPNPTPPQVFIFSTCDGTFVRVLGGGQLGIFVDGVETLYAVNGSADIQLGQLPDGTVVSTVLAGAENRVLTVDNGDCATPTPSPSPSPSETPPPWTPTFTPAPPVNPTHPELGNGGNLAFTGFTAGDLIPWAAGLALMGLGALAWSRKRARV